MGASRASGVKKPNMRLRSGTRPVRRPLSDFSEWRRREMAFWMGRSESGTTKQVRIPKIKWMAADM